MYTQCWRCCEVTRGRLVGVWMCGYLWLTEAGKVELQQKRREVEVALQPMLRMSLLRPATRGLDCRGTPLNAMRSVRALAASTMVCSDRQPVDLSAEDLGRWTKLKEVAGVVSDANARFGSSQEAASGAMA